ncbi:MAG: LacI family transcriptional regulator [Chloroflexi bacterium]|nr:LacI family transcriptional regulator [Chloroflexota bacterium]
MQASSRASKASSPALNAPTIKQIASRLGVSHSTVSRALNDHRHTSEATKERVRIAARTMGYIPHGPARAMRGARTSLVGLIIPDIQNYFYATVARVIAQTCAARSLQLVLAVSEDDAALEYRHAMALREAHAGGIIVVPCAAIQRRTSVLLNGSPTVQLVRTSPQLHGQSVAIDDRLGTRTATEHLLAQGHRRLAFVGGPPALSTGRSRLAGFSEAVAATGLSIGDMAVELGPPRGDFAHAATVRILDRPSRPTALVLGGAELAVGALTAVRDAQLRVPEDLSLVGYGDPEWFRLWSPSLTTVGLPVEEVASTTAALLFQMMHLSDAPLLAESAAVRIVVEPRLIVRASTRTLG